MSRITRSLRLGLLPGLFALGIAGVALAQSGNGWLGVSAATAYSSTAS